MNGARLGTLIGSIGGLAFAAGNAGGLPQPLPWLAPAVAVALLVAVLVWRIVSGRLGDPRPPSEDAFRVYWISVGLMVLSFIVGAQLLMRVFDATYLTPAWVAFAVGAHFVPFARTFGAPVFAVLGVAMMAETVVGGALAVLVDERFAAAAAVAVGLTMLGCMLAGPDLGRSLAKARPKPQASGA